MPQNRVFINIIPLTLKGKGGVPDAGSDEYPQPNRYSIHMSRSKKKGGDVPKEVLFNFESACLRMGPVCAVPCSLERGDRESILHLQAIVEMHWGTGT